MDAGTTDRTREKPLAIQDLVTVIEPHDVELFVRKRSQTHTQEAGGIHRVADGTLPLKLLAQDVFGSRQDGLRGVDGTIGRYRC